MQLRSTALLLSVAQPVKIKVDLFAPPKYLKIFSRAISILFLTLKLGVYKLDGL